MNTIALETTADRYIISVDKSAISKELINSLLDRIRMEYLAEKVDFSEDIEVLGEEIKQSWWQKYKNRITEMVETHEKGNH
jgi:6-pyruvoyl-tetrahydropterin synthase